jgi:AraC-like DNA-binding protein
VNNKSFLNKSKARVLSVIILPLILLMPLCIDLFHLSRSIFPAREFGNRIAAYSDTSWKGGSTVDRFYFDSKSLVLSYTLREGYSFPMVFISISLDADGKGCDLSAYDRVSVRINRATMTGMSLYTKTFIPGISKLGGENAITLRHSERMVFLDPAIRDYEIMMSEFITPQWWFQMAKADPDRVGKEKFERVMSFDLQFMMAGSGFKSGNKETISIERIVFTRPLSAASFVLAGIMIAWYAGLGFILLGRRSGRSGRRVEPLPEQQHIGVVLVRDRELKRIKTFLEARYSDPNISTRMIYSELGIPPARVFTLLREHYHLTFKQIINTMRIEEAKHLLRETDLRITEIAMKLGFSDISYFNRLFKDHEKVTPSDYRDNAFAG